MKVLLSFLFFLVATVACQNKKSESKETDAATPAVEESSEGGENSDVSVNRDLNVEEDSLVVLQEHIADIQKFLELAKGPDSANPKFAEIANHANSLVTHYQFEVVPPIRRQAFRDAAYAWDLGELYVTRLTETYDLAFVAKQELGDAWRDLQTSRELMLALKADWDTF